MRSSAIASQVASRQPSTHPADDEPVTVRRLVVREEAPPSQALTMRLPRIDPQLLALARGEREGRRAQEDIPTLAPPVAEEEPVDPFGGLILVTDDDATSELAVDDLDILEATPIDEELAFLGHALVNAKPRRV